MTYTDGHLLAHRQPEAADGFDAAAALFDPTTFRHLEALGIGPGWRCWEVGAGGTSVVSWLAKKVGPTGRVVATDIDISRLAPVARPPVQVRPHDVGVEEPPGEGFDLVHARLVLVHVPDRTKALRSMIRALRPGGRLLVEDADPTLQPLSCPDEHGPEQQLANRVRQGLRRLLAHRGADLAYGRTLPRLLRQAGLRRVEADAYFPITSPACAALEAATIHQVRDQLVTAGLVTDQEIDRHLANVGSGSMDLATAPMISAWGRKAESRGHAG
ncbi:methyltransferase domain-containing protein [Streptomyces leeuwenhoekii]|uniref:Methyltransferase n=1 Tax=Streptomyces leeuwenhoekii TaxID=1437453 RepID=A0A0F7VXW3_STRLW|nr:methyltransferase domain-containing protein [Streptomyces leeuwenhoekii]KMS81901.1 methyltransferase [Streptomyces leeuwenhoekii]CQR64625.1 Methyltransferase [Streptomyces leeuwenhoekii]